MSRILTRIAFWAALAVLNFYPSMWTVSGAFVLGFFYWPALESTEN